MYSRSNKGRAIAYAAAVTVGLMTLTTMTHAQSPMRPENPSANEFDSSDTVIQNDLSGPRLGFTYLPDHRLFKSQFGWHFESQATSGQGGAALIVERVFLIGGIEDDRITPSATLVFGIRSRQGFEVGLGPSVAVGPAGFSSAIVVAAGHSYRMGGIRVPVNLAVALDKGGQNRVSFVTGWAIRERPEDRERRERIRESRRNQPWHHWDR